jgi:hypothetical protein
VLRVFIVAHGLQFPLRDRAERERRLLLSLG